MFFSGYVFAQTGEINGIVRDAATKQPLIGANVMVLDTELGVATNIEGRFRIDGIPTGTHHLRITMIGYEPQVYLNLPVTVARPVMIEADLIAKPIQIEAVEVTGEAFTRSTAATVSTLHVDNVEIRSDPGGVYDIQRVVQSLPSVTTATDQENEIITRGGLPGENLFLMDDIEIPNPNHFGFEGAGGGPVNMINTLFARQIEFTPGAFSAKYGDKASSVMDITLREGSRHGFEIDLDMSMAGIGVNAEGPLSDGKGSILASSKFSYLDFIIQSTGMTAIPRYNSHQFKLVYDIKPDLRVIISGLAGFDEINIKSENDVVTYGAESVDYDGNTLVGGISLQKLLGGRGYGLTTLSAVQKNSFNWVYNSGNREDVWFTRDDKNSEYTLKTNWVLHFTAGSLTIGGSVKHMDLNYKEWAATDTTFIYDTSMWTGDKWLIDSPNWIGILEIQPVFNFNESGNEWKLAKYAQWKMSIGKQSTLTSGLRGDYYFATEEFLLSPRLNVKTDINPVTTLHFGLGRQYQYPDNYLILRTEQNRSLKAKYSDQIVLGMERYVGTDFKASIETYYKKYDNIPTHYYWTHPREEFPDTLSHVKHWLNEGEGRSCGLEIFLQKKLTRNWHGILSYSWSHAQGKDIRRLFGNSQPGDPPMKGEWYDWDFDIRHQLTMVGGWKKKFHQLDWYNQLKQKTWYKIASNVFGMVNPLADEVELSFRFAFNSGRPYTPRDYHPDLRIWLPSETDWNSSRYPEYHRFDIMFIRRYIFRKVNLVTYFDIMNVFNRDNIWDFAYNEDGTKGTVWQYKTMPVGGFTIEF